MASGNVVEQDGARYWRSLSYSVYGGRGGGSFTSHMDGRLVFM